jgi:hypothetical protein
MYYLYSGTGYVSDSSGTHRTIQVTAMISDQLMTGNPGVEQPVHVTPGHPLIGGRYLFEICDWHVAVDKIGTFFGSNGCICFQLANPSLIADLMWFFKSDATTDATNDYNWMGEIGLIEQPSRQDWPNPSTPKFAQLPLTIICGGACMGATIGKLFCYPTGSGIAPPAISFSLSRV